MNEVLARLIRGENLDATEAEDLFLTLVDEEQDASFIGAVLAAFAAKGETAAEVRGFVGGMRRLAVKPSLPDGIQAIDIVGTGGDGSASLNLSTGAALLTAACGVPVLKHGNRAISSRCGSADVLEALGVDLPRPEQVGAMITEANFAFLFAPYFHPAMKQLAPIRKALGVRTIFNILGPLTNPASPPFYLLGAYAPDIAELMADTLSGLPINRASVVHGALGWDEPTPVGPFREWRVRPGSVEAVERNPADYGVPRCDSASLAGSSAPLNAQILAAALHGEPGAVQDALVLGAGLAMEVAGAVDSLEGGIARARERIADGAARRHLERLTRCQPARVLGDV